MQVTLGKLEAIFFKLLMCILKHKPYSLYSYKSLMVAITCSVPTVNAGNYAGCSLENYSGTVEIIVMSHPI